MQVEVDDLSLQKGFPRKHFCTKLRNGAPEELVRKTYFLAKLEPGIYYLKVVRRNFVDNHVTVYVFDVPPGCPWKYPQFVLIEKQLLGYCEFCTNQLQCKLTTKFWPLDEMLEKLKSYA